MVSHHDREEGRVEHFTVNACLAPLCSVHGMAVTTVEGIGSTQTALHACQVCGGIPMYMLRTQSIYSGTSDKGLSE